MDTLWLMCGIAVVAVGLLMLFGGSRGRSLDEVYARRASARATERPAADPAPATPATVVVPVAAHDVGRHRVGA